jgi:hypothetical protein
MSKPTTPGELRDVKVDSISLVAKAANRKTFKIFKSADNGAEPDGKQKEAPAAAKDEQGLFRLLKSFFAPDDVAKGDMEDKYRASEKRDDFNKAIEALRQTLGYSWDSKGVLTDVKEIRTALSDFQKICGEILLGKDSDIKKFAEEVCKSGRKISATRLAEIKAAHAALAKIIEETDGDGKPGQEGDASVVKEELEKLIKGSVAEAVKPLAERLDGLEKHDEDATGEGAAPDAKDGEPGADRPGDVKKDESTGQEIAEIIKTSIAEAIAPIGERLEKLEKARGFSNKIPEESNVQKSGPVFAGAFLAD